MTAAVIAAATLASRAVLLASISGIPFREQELAFREPQASLLRTPSQQPDGARGSEFNLDSCCLAVTLERDKALQWRPLRMQQSEQPLKIRKCRGSQDYHAKRGGRTCSWSRVGEGVHAYADLGR
jgi:hypothetical protein